jgi:hypothetical protein
VNNEQEQTPQLDRLEQLTQDIPTDHQDQLGLCLPDPMVPFSDEGYLPPEGEE